jgi:hypothetical protein
MDDRDLTPRDPEAGDHWDVYAEAMDLTIEGHRLIAQEIIYEVKLLWRGATSWLRGIIAASPRRGSTPPV